MQEALKKVIRNTAEPVGRIVTLCIRSQQIQLHGIWNWEMQSSAVYCSDVMSFPDELESTKGIIHPDDLPKLMGALTLMEGKEMARLDFRIITTYGEVKTISGQRVFIEDDKNKTAEPVPGKERWEEVLVQIAAEKEIDFLCLRKELSEISQRHHNIGSWFIIKDTGQTWYLDNVYRIYGLAPQSLNANSNTFQHFIHEDDRAAVINAFDQAYAEEVSLHLEYRIVLPDDTIHYVQQITKWIFTRNGQLVFSGILRDVTEERAIADELLAAQINTQLHQQLLKVSEQQSLSGYWYVNLITRKSSFSENYYRIYGLKPNMLSSFKSFVNLVHPEDREKVNGLLDKMYEEHVLPEMEFRLIRPDGKLRYVKQVSKSFISSNKELIIIGLIQDITAQKGLELKIAELNETVSLNKMVTEMAESMANLSSIIWFADGRMAWSDGLYQFLGYRPGSIEPLSRLLHKSIYPADLKTFKDAELLVMNHQEHEDIFVRMVSKAGVKQVRISFKKIHYGQDAVIALVQDVSRQISLQHELANTIKYNELLSNSANDLLLFTNIDHTVMHWNAKAVEKTGVGKEEALQQNLFDVLPRLNEEGFLNHLHSAIRGNEVHISRAEACYLQQPHDYSLLPLKNDKDEVIGVLHMVHDISKQLELQRQLSERLKFIESLLEASIDLIVVLDRYMNYLFWNKKAEEYYAIPKEKVIGKNILEVFPSFRNHPGYQEFRTVLRGETVFLPAKIDDESQEYSETYLIPVKDDRGDVMSILWIVHDLSRELQLTKERTQAANLLKATMDASKEMIQVFEAVRNEDGDIVDFRWVLMNEEAQKWMPDSVGKSLLQLQPGVVEEGIFDTFKQVIETGTPDQSERHYVHEQFDGWFYQSTVKLNDGVATITRNITERKKAEQELLRLKDEIAQQATNKYSTLFNSIDEGFSIIDLIHDDNGNLVDFIYSEINPAFIRHVGVDLHGKRRSELYFDKKDFVLGKYDHLAKTGEPLNFEHHVQAPSDQWFQVSASRIGGVGSTQLGVVFRNITERKQQEQKQQYLLQLSDALRTLSDPDEILNEALRIVGEYLDLDRVVYNEIDPDVTEYWHRANYTREGFASVIGRYPMDPFKETVRNLQKGITFIANDAYDDSFTEAEKAAHRRINVGAYVTAPLVKNGRWVCNLVAHYSKPRNWMKNEVAILEETAERIWAAVERGKAEQALRVSEERLHMATSASKIGTYMYYPLEDRGEPDDQAFALFGLKRDGIVNFAEAMVHNIHAEDRERHMKAVMAALDPSSNGKADTEFRVVHPNGSVHWLHSVAQAYFEGNPPQPTKMPGVTIDITERKKAEEALRESEERFRTLVTATSETVYKMSADWKVMVQLEGKSFLKDTHAETTEWLKNYIPEHEQERVRATIEKAIQNKSVFELEHQVYDAKGNLSWVYSRAIPKLDENGSIIEWMGAASDITQRKEAEKQLKDFTLMLEQQVEEKTKVTLEQTRELQKNLMLLQYTEYLAQSGTWEYEITTGNFTWSTGMYKMFGLPQQMKVRPEVYLDFAIEEDRHIAKKIVNHLKKKYDPFEEIIRIKRGNEIRTIKVKSSVVYDENKTAQKAIGVDFDITNVVKAEEQLKESRHWLEQTAKASPDSITIYDLQTKQPTYLNNCLGEWIGVESDELIRMGIEERLKIIHPDDRLILLHFNEKIAAAKDGEMLTMEYRVKNSEGKTVWVRNRSKPFQRNANGKVTHMLSILQNVTEEVQLREELKRRTQYAEAIIDASIDRIAVYDKELRVIAWNRRSEQVTGSKREKILGQKLFDVFPKVAQDEDLLKAHLDALEGQYVSLPSKKGVYTNGYYERFYIPLKNERGETYAVVSIMHDVSEIILRNEELKELNSSLEQKNIQLEQKNEEITSFAFVASHDMKEPLRKIHTFSDWLMEQESKNLSEKGKSLLEKINAGVHRIEVLIEDILILTKIHSDTGKKEEVNLNRVLNQAFDDMFEQILLTQTGVHADELPIVKGNPNQIYYLFRNLISNAIKFQRLGNVPQITVTGEIVSGKETGLPDAFDEYAKVCFIDNGFGLDQRYAKKIFQIFQRLHGRHEFEGTGIGLAICKKIMENHEGVITVESEQEKGSVFSCYFPLH